MNRRVSTLIATLCAVLLATGGLGGCVGMVIGGAATAGLAAYSERGIEGTARDAATATEIHAKLLAADDKMFLEVGVEVYEGRVLLTGRVPNEQMRADAVRICWQVSSTKDVINELIVSERPLSDIANDTWITTQIKARMTVNKEILAVNYSVETVSGIVYLIGIAQDQAELDRVVDIVRNTKYVKQVVNHVRIKAPGEKKST